MFGEVFVVVNITLIILQKSAILPKNLSGFSLYSLRLVAKPFSDA